MNNAFLINHPSQRAAPLGITQEVADWYNERFNQGCFLVAAKHYEYEYLAALAALQLSLASE